jgi:hypothetical protein
MPAGAELCVGVRHRDKPLASWPLPCPACS